MKELDEGRDWDDKIQRSQLNKMLVKLHKFSFGDGYIAQRPFPDTPVR